MMISLLNRVFQLQTLPAMLHTRLDIDFQGIVQCLRKQFRHSSSSLSSGTAQSTHRPLYLKHPSTWTIHPRRSSTSDHQPGLTSRALFENYDQDLKQLIGSLKGKLEGDVKQLKGGMSSLSPDEMRLMNRTAKVCTEEGIGGTR